MKRKKGLFVTLSACMVACLMLTACGKGTGYPDEEEMQTNLEKNLYSMTISNKVDDDDKFTGSHLSAHNQDGEYLEFYWLDDPEAVDVVVEKLKSEHSDSAIVSLKGEGEKNSIVFCGTDSAVESAGIKGN